MYIYTCRLPSYFLFRTRTFLRPLVNFYTILEKQVWFCKFYAYPAIGLCVKTTEEHFKICKVSENRTAKSISYKNCKEIASRWLRIETI